MSERAQAGFGVQIVWGTLLVGEVNGDVVMPDKTANEKDSTSHDNLKGIGTKILTSITQGDGSFKCFYYGAAEQDAMSADADARTSRPIQFIFPPYGKLKGVSRKFNAQIKSIKETLPQDGFINWDVTFTPNSAPIKISTLAAGLTTPWLSFADDDANALTPTESPANATYDYNLECYSDNTWITVTPTAAVGTIYVNGTGVTSGAASGHITAPTNIGDVIMVLIMVTEAGKTPQVYKVRVQKGLTAHP